MTGAIEIVNPTKREIAILVEWLRLAKHLDDACPDVGAGPSLKMLLEDSPFSLGGDVVSLILDGYKSKYGKC